MKKIILAILLAFITVQVFSNDIDNLPLQNVPIYEGVDEFSEKINQIREKENREPLGLVLCGGSARAFAHIGVLKAMEENEIVPDFIVANSMGAIIGMLYAYGFSPDKMYEIASKLNLNSYFDIVSPFKGGVISVRKFTALINEVIGKEKTDINECTIPILLLTEDLNTKRQIWHATGDFSQVMAAAFAMTFFMEPVDYELLDGTKVKLVDSGTIDIAGLKVANAFSKNLIISTAFYDKKVNLNNPIVVINRTMSIGKERIAIGDIRELQPVLIRNDVENFSFMEFKKLKELTQAGYDSTIKKIDEIKALPHGNADLSEKRKETDKSSLNIIKRIERNSEIKIQQNYFGMKIRPNVSTLDYPDMYLYNNYGAGIYAFGETPNFFGRIGIGTNFTSPDYSVDMYLKFRPNYNFQAYTFLSYTFLYDGFVPNKFFTGLSLKFIPDFLPSFIRDFSLSAEWNANSVFRTEKFFSSINTTFQNKKNENLRIVFKPLLYLQGESFESLSLGLGANSENLFRISYFGFSQNASARYSFLNFNESEKPVTELNTKDFYRSSLAKNYLQDNSLYFTSSTELFFSDTKSNITFAEFLILQKIDLGGYLDIAYDGNWNFTSGGFLRLDLSILGLSSFVLESGCGWDFPSEKVYGFFFMKTSI